MLLPRQGFNSQMVVPGDPTPVDLPGGQRSGLAEVVDVLRRLGMVDPEAAVFMRKHPLVRDALSRSGRSVSAEATAQQRLVQLTVRWLQHDTDTQFQRLSVRRQADGLGVTVETVPMSTSMRFAVQSPMDSTFRKMMSTKAIWRSAYTVSRSRLNARFVRYSSSRDRQ